MGTQKGCRKVISPEILGDYLSIFLGLAIDMDLGWPSCPAGRGISVLEAGPCPSSHSRLLQGRMSHFDTPEDGFDGKQIVRCFFSLGFKVN